MIFPLLAILLTLILVVGLHEAGHALCAKLFGVRIRRIAIGFGKPIVKYKDKAGREWVWGIWPLGGYVHLLNSRIEKVSEQEFPYCFDKKPIWQRCIILLAGALANLLTAFLALTIMYLLGYQRQIPIIKALSPQSIAARADLKANDRFIRVGSYKTNSWQDLGMILLIEMGKKSVPAEVINQQGLIRQVNLELSQWPYKKGASTLFAALGLKTPAPNEQIEQVKGRPFLQASCMAAMKLGFLIKFFLIMIKQVFTHKIPFAVLLGPLGLITTTVHSFLQGFSVFMYFIASFSLAVALVNLFPIPGLDGGLIIYALIEKIRGEPLSIAFEVLMHQLALILFVLIFLQLILNDLQRYVRG